MTGKAAPRASRRRPPPAPARYWLRTIRGLEWVAAAEAASAVDGAQITFGHRSVFVAGAAALDPAILRCSDDVFFYWAQLSNLDHTRETLNRLSTAARALPSTPIDISEFHGLHVTASFLGRRNYSRGEIEQAFGQSLAAALGPRWHMEMPKASGNLRVRIHLAGDRAVIGVGATETPTHRRPWRVHTRAGMLHPPVAAAIAFLADLQEGLTVHDPFAGSGTILIEAGLRCPKLKLSGWDVNAETISIAKDHAARAGVVVDFHVKDAFTAPRELPKPDRVLSNPPWEVSVSSGGKNPLDVLVDLLSSDALAVAITDQSMQIASFCQRAGLTPDISFPIRLSGRIADITIIRKKPHGLSNELKRYWTAMENISWQADEGGATLGVPTEWGDPIPV